jgi:CDP-6-deoxy-D-xylo-4-hexulose-3-dehydrase
MILVSVLGLSPDMDAITTLCDKYDVILLEDNCESQGTSYQGTKLGNFGVMSSFSTYFGHTMSTIEGGIVTTNDQDIYNTLVQLRSHGWDRDLDQNTQIELRDKWGIDNFSSLYTFYLPGFNLRSTDLQAFLGINQLDKVDASIEKRNLNFKIFESLLKDVVWFPKQLPNTFTASFCIPVIFKTAEQKHRAIKLLLENKIECRPLISGSMGTQPFYKKVYGEYRLKNCSIVDERGIYVPNHPKLTIEEVQLICRLIIQASK